jgi:hypothetical protein
MKLIWYRQTDVMLSAIQLLFHAAQQNIKQFFMGMLA